MNKSEQGKQNKRMGADFERRVRADLMERGWIVSKWQNNIKDGKCVQSRPSKFRLMQTGFPDFIVLKLTDKSNYVVNFVECKVNGYLSKEEKEKAEWYLKNNYCSKFIIASKKLFNGKVEIIYKEFERGLKDGKTTN